MTAPLLAQALSRRFSVFLRWAAPAAVVACHGAPVVEAAYHCADPCCGGSLEAIDCAENPNLSCTEDADVCIARAYGCEDGKVFTRPPSQLPTSCALDGAVVDVGLLLLGDASVGPEEDASTE